MPKNFLPINTIIKLGWITELSSKVLQQDKPAEGGSRGSRAAAISSISASTSSAVILGYLRLPNILSHQQPSIVQ